MFPVCSTLATDLVPSKSWPVAPTEQSNLIIRDLSADALTALAGGANPGTAITTRWARFATVASAGDSASLPPSWAGLAVTVRNDATHDMIVYPASGERINGQTANTPMTIAAGHEATFRCFAKGGWWAAPSN